MADGKQAEAQINRKLRSAFLRRKIALEVILAQLRQKIAQLLLRRSFAARERQRLAHKAQIGQGRQARRGACGGGQLRLQSR